MAKRIPRFRQADISRVLRGAFVAGMKVSQIEITPDGKVVIVFGEGQSGDITTELDDWIRRYAGKS